MIGILLGENIEFFYEAKKIFGGCRDNIFVPAYISVIRFHLQELTLQ